MKSITNRAKPLEKRERLYAIINSQPIDRLPVALWQHFPKVDQSPNLLAAATLQFQNSWDWDFVKISPASSFCLRDWGVKDEFVVNDLGNRNYMKRVVNQPSDWLRLKVLDPYAGFLGNQLACIRLVMDSIDKKTPVLQTIFSPLYQAHHLASSTVLQAHAELFPDFLHEGLQTIAKSTMDFMLAALELGVDGFFFATRQDSGLTIKQYYEFGCHYELQLLDTIKESKAFFNVLHIHGDQINFDLFTKYPVQAWNWHDQITPLTLSDGLKKVLGTVIGGISQSTLAKGDIARLRFEITNTFSSTQEQHFILGTSCVTPIITPVRILKYVRESVEDMDRRPIYYP